MLFKYSILFLVLVSFTQNSNSQAGIKAQLILDTAIWNPVAYLSLIQDFEAMNTMSYEMITDKAIIDDSGRFSFDTKYFPDGDNLFRIHISKKTDPPASLIIGGNDENHFFVVANKNSQIIIKDSSSIEFIKDIKIEGYYPNQMFRQINEIAGYLDMTSFNGSLIKSELIRNAIYEKLRQYADTCSNPLVSLYALYKSQFEKNYPVNQQFYKNFLTKWKQERSTYFTEFRKRIPSAGNSKVTLLLFLGGLFFIIGFLVGLAVIKLSKKKQNVLKDLSVQERKIFTLIMEGKSNKEISEVLKISLSTVKSHVNSIYTKLDINSRKDVLNLNLENKD